MKIKNKALLAISTLVVALIILINFESLLAMFRPGNEVWQHIRTHLLWGYTVNTVGVVGFSMLFAGVIGTISAYFVSCFDFPFRKTLSLLLYLPLAIPPYIMAYAYVNILGPFGLLHNAFGFHLRVPPFWLSVLVFTLSLFPYVYIGVKAFISHGMTSHIENARLLKKSEWQIFFTVILPIAKTAILTGMVLVGLEVMGDFGALHYLGVNTFSTAIFRSWIAFRDFDSALRLSGFAILSVFSLLVLKGMIMRFQRPSASNAKTRGASPFLLKGHRVILPLVVPGLVVMAALALPLYRLMTWAVMSFRQVRYADMASMVFNTVFISLVATVIILVLAFLVATYTRTSKGFAAVFYGKTTLISYALPGAVVAMVTLFFFTRVDRFIPVAMTTTVAMLLIGYVVRYLGIAYENMEDGYKKIGTRHHEAARTLGKGYYKTVFTVDLPMLKPFLLSAIALVFIDLVKELPLTLILRPFNFNTLAVQVHQYASSEMLPQVAIPSLLIISISMVFILLLLRIKRRA